MEESLVAIETIGTLSKPVQTKYMTATENCIPNTPSINNSGNYNNNYCFV